MHLQQSKQFKQPIKILKEYMAYHDIGDNTCENCLDTNKACQYEYIVNDISYIICKECNKILNKDENNIRIECIWSDYIDDNLGINYLSSNDKSLKYSNGCSLKRPDKLYLDNKVTYILECDENQHKHIDSTCEDKRITELNWEIMNNFANINKTSTKLVVLRWNPHLYNSYENKNQQERLDFFIKVFQNVLKKNPINPITIIYMYYDKTTKSVSNIESKCFLFDENDCLKKEFINLFE